jgi:hypothetical protein
MTFAGSFHPDQEVGAAGALWLISQNGPGSASSGCQVARLDPVSLSMVTYPLSACGMNVAAGGGELYLETAQSQPDNSYRIHIETFSVSARSSTVLSPVAMTVFGSEIAHTQLAYADGWLWLYGYTNGAEVVQVSPSSGAVVNTFTTGVPEIGGTEPLISAGAGGVWLAGGPGGSSTLARLWVPPTGLEWVLTPLAASISSLPDTTTVEWLGTVAGRLWVGEAGPAVSPAHPNTLAERIVVLDSPGSGQSGEGRGSLGVKESPNVEVLGSVSVVKRSAVENFGLAPESVGGEVFSVGPGQTCGIQPIWRVDPSSLRTSVVTTLHPPVDPCWGEESFRSVTSTGGAVFVLDSSDGPAPGVLYRIEG